MSGSEFGYLSLGRRVGETVCIGDDIEVTVVSVQGYQVKLNFKVPKTMAVDRSEIRQRKDAGEPKPEK